MKTINCSRIARVIKNHKRLMEELNVKITNRGREVTIIGTPEDEYIAAQTIEALNFGFPYLEAISMKKEGKLMETVNIKEYTSRRDMEQVRGRLIGQGGKALRTLSNLTGCAVELKENTIGIIGEPENLERAASAAIAIAKGAKHSSVWRELENSQPKPIYDLGLRDAPVKTMEEYEDALAEFEEQEEAPRKTMEEYKKTLKEMGIEEDEEDF